MEAKITIPTLLRKNHAFSIFPSIAGGTALQCICT